MRGMILGTAAYMAPEQAKGKAVDRRADVWAFGAVLYEMLTGRRAFTGEDITDTIVAVVSKEPDWSALPAATPAGLRRLLTRCLKKDARARLQAIGEARVLIDELLGGAPADMADAGAVAPAAPRALRLAWIVSAAAVLAAIALAVPTVRHLRETSPSAPLETRLDIVTPATEQPTSFALSPDGRQIVFVASADGGSRLWLRSLATTTAQPLAGTEGAAYPFWSPDGRSIGFFADAKLKRIDLESGSGAARTVAGEQSQRRNLECRRRHPVHADRREPAVSRAGLGRHAGRGDHARWADEPSVSRLPSRWPALPVLRGRDAGHARNLSGRARRAEHVPTDGGRHGGGVSARRTWVRGASRDGGWLLWVREGALVAQRLDLERQALIGDPLSIADPVAVDAATNAAAVSVSAGGLVAYRTGAGTRRRLVWLDRSGKELGALGALDENEPRDLSVSPDGHRAVVSRTVQGNQDLGYWMAPAPAGSRSMRKWTVFPSGPPTAARLCSASTEAGSSTSRRRTVDLYQKSSSGAGAETCSWRPRRARWRRTGPRTAGFCSTTASIRKRTGTSGCCRWKPTARPGYCSRRRSPNAVVRSHRTGAGWLTTPTNRGGRKSTSGRSR